MNKEPWRPRFCRLPAAAACCVALAVVGAVGEKLGRAADTPKAKFNKVLRIGDQAPDWHDLPGVDDKRHNLEDFKDAKVLVIVFTCNHCPVARMYEERLLKFARRHKSEEVQVVAISVSRNAADNLEKMKSRAQSNEYPFPYLHDASQESGKAYGATVTPHFFVLDGERKVAYMGAFDDHFEIDKVEKRYVVEAVDALLAGKAPRTRESLQRGCAIEYE